jgi:hypothetical protein
MRRWVDRRLGADATRDERGSAVGGVGGKLAGGWGDVQWLDAPRAPLRERLLLTQPARAHDEPAGARLPC